MQILKEFNFQQYGEGGIRDGIIRYTVPVSSLPHFYIFPQAFGGNNHQIHPDAESLIAATFKDEYTHPKQHNLDGICVYVARQKDSLREHDLVVLAVVVYQNEGILIYGWGPPARTDEIFRMLETMLLTVKVEPP